MRVDPGQVQLACDEKQNGSHGFESRVAAGLGGLEQAGDGSRNPLVCRVCAWAMMPSKCLRIMRAISLIGSAFERITLVHHCLSSHEIDPVLRQPGRSVGTV